MWAHGDVNGYPLVCMRFTPSISGALSLEVPRGIRNLWPFFAENFLPFSPPRTPHTNQKFLTQKPNPQRNHHNVNQHTVNMRPSTVAASALVLAAAGQAAHAPENTATQQAAVEAPTVAKIDSARFYLSRADKRKVSEICLLLVRPHDLRRIDCDKPPAGL